MPEPTSAPDRGPRPSSAASTAGTATAPSAPAPRLVERSVGAAPVRAGASTPAVASGLSPDVTFERTWLDRRSWVDVARNVLHDPTAVTQAILGGLTFSEGQIFRYDHWVDVPRVGSSYPLDRPPHPALHEVHRALQHRYGVRFAAPAVALYRDERDGVAFHRDRDMRWLDDTRIALLVLGARRPFALRPRANRHAHDLPDKGAVIDLAPGEGDLLVMGGGCQAGWEHSVPPVTYRVAPRLSVQWRWTSRTGRQERGGSYSDPRHFSTR